MPQEDNKVQSQPRDFQSKNSPLSLWDFIVYFLSQMQYSPEKIGNIANDAMPNHHSKCMNT